MPQRQATSAECSWHVLRHTAVNEISCYFCRNLFTSLRDTRLLRKHGRRKTGLRVGDVGVECKKLSRRRGGFSQSTPTRSTQCERPCKSRRVICKNASFY